MRRSRQMATAKAFDVAALIGVGEAPDQLALAGGVAPRRALAVGGRQPRFEGGSDAPRRLSERAATYACARSTRS